MRATLAVLTFVALATPCLAGEREDLFQFETIQRGLDAEQWGLREAVTQADIALRLAKSLYGTTDERTALAAERLASLLAKADDMGSAIAMSRITVDWRSAIHGRTSEEVIERLRITGNYERNADRVRDALGSFEQALEIAVELHGRNSPDTLRHIFNLCGIHQDLGEYRKAVEICDLAVKVAEVTNDRIKHANALIRLAEVHEHSSQYNAAIKQFDEAVKLFAERTDPESVRERADAELRLANALKLAGRLDEAKDHFIRSQEDTRAAFGEESFDFASISGHLSELLFQMGKSSQAVALHREVYRKYAKFRGKDDPYTLNILTTLAHFLLHAGQYEEAERSIVEVLDKMPGAGVDPSWILNAKRIHGQIKVAQGNLPAAASLFEEVLREQQDAELLEQLAETYMGQGKDAATLLSRALEIRENSDTVERSIEEVMAHSDALYTMQRFTEARGLVASLLQRKGLTEDERADAEALAGRVEIELKQEDAAIEHLKRAMDHYVKNREHNWMSIASLLSFFVRIELSKPAPDVTSAISQLRERIALYNAVGLQEHPDLIPAYSVLGLLQTSLDDWDEGAKNAKLAAELKLKVMEADGVTDQSSDQLKSLLNTGLETFSLYMMIERKRWEMSPALRKQITANTFKIGQKAFASSAALAIDDLGKRAGQGSTEIRVYQDLLRERAQLQKRMVQMVGTGRRPLGIFRSMVDRAKELEVQIAAARALRGAESASSVAVADVEEVQQRLDIDEALLLYADAKAGPDASKGATYLWVISRTEAVWFELPMDTEDLSAEVARIRDNLGIGSATRSARSLSKVARERNAINGLHELYRNVLAGAYKLTEGKRMLIVPSRSLSAIPFEILATELHTDDDGRMVPTWLIEENTLAVLPSVASFLQLEERSKPSPDSMSYLAYANPLLTGASRLDRSAFALKTCADASEVVARSAGILPRGLSGSDDILADPEQLRRLSPLPESAYEVCQISRGFDRRAHIALGAAATEGNLKALDRSGELGTMDIVQFATHGLLSFSAEEDMEPALVFTPPDQASTADDGLLTMSEIVKLRMNAEWVLLSACNTASASENSQEAFSGLSSAFLYAGAKALLVSHWPVNSIAAVEITTRTMEAYLGTPGITKADAHRQALISLIKQGGKRADPTYWGPFVLVGDYR